MTPPGEYSFILSFQKSDENVVEGRKENIVRDAKQRDLNPQSQIDMVKSSVRSTPIGPKLIDRFVSRFAYGDSDEL